MQSQPRSLADAVSPHIRRADPTFQMPSRAGSSKHEAVLRPAGSGQSASLPRPARQGVGLRRWPQQRSGPGAVQSAGQSPASLGRLSPLSRMWSNHCTERSVRRLVSRTPGALVSQIQLVEHRRGLGSQTRPVRPGCLQPGVGSPSVSCGQADRSHAVGPSGTHEIWVPSNTARQTDYQAVMASVVNQTQSVSQMQLARH